MATVLMVPEFRIYFGNIFSNVTEYPDASIQLQLDEALIEVSESIFKKYYRRAAYYLTAHFLTIWHEQQVATLLDSTGTTASNPKGVVSSASVGDLSITQEMPEYSTSSDDKFLASTIFGQEFIRLRNKMSRGTLLARVPMIGNNPNVICGDYLP